MNDQKILNNLIAENRCYQKQSPIIIEYEIETEMNKFVEILGTPSTTFLGNPRAKRATTLPARVFFI